MDYDYAELKAAVLRVRRYIDRRRKGRGIDVESIHAFDAGPDGSIELRLSDLNTLLSALKGE